MIESPETMLELQSAADALGVHYQTAYRWVRSGRLPAQLTGGKYLVSAHDVAEVGANRERPQTPAAPSPARLQRQSERLHQALLDGDEGTLGNLRADHPDSGRGELLLEPLEHRLGGRQDFSTTLPVKPSVTTTSQTPRKRSLPSTLPTNSYSVLDIRS